MRRPSRDATITLGFVALSFALAFWQRPGDAAWNTANCRNRRIFKDRAVQKTAANTKPFLLQTYRRDMGGGQFVLLKEAAAPITVQGRHWGGMRLAFNF